MNIRGLTWKIVLPFIALIPFRASGAIYNISDFDGLINHDPPFVNADQINILKNITATKDIGSLGDFELTLTGKGYSFLGDSNSGFILDSNSNYSFSVFAVSNFSNTSGGSAFTINGGILTLNDTELTGNTVNAAGEALGGAIYNNAGTVNLIDTAIFNNAAMGTTAKGGVIYTTGGGRINLSATNGAMIIQNNVANGQSSFLYLDEGTLNIDAVAEAAIVILNDIESSNQSNAVNINTQTNSNGAVMLGAGLKNVSVTIAGGEVVFSENTVFENNVVNFQKGRLNTVNNIFEDIRVSSWQSTSNSFLAFDADLDQAKSDVIISDTMTGAIKIKAINILADGTSDIQVFRKTSAGNLNASFFQAVSSYEGYTNNYKYTFSALANGYLRPTQTASSDGFRDFVKSSSAAYRSFSATQDVVLSADIGATGNFRPTLTMIGSGFDLDGNNLLGIASGFSSTINIFGFGQMNPDGTVKSSIHNFGKVDAGTSSNFGFLYNDNRSVLSLSSSVFYDNLSASSTHSSKGGVIHNYNSSIAQIFSSHFISNSSEVTGGMLSASGGAISSLNSSSLFVVMSSFVSNTAHSTRGNAFGGAIENQGNMTINNTSFINNSSVNLSMRNALGGAIYNSLPSASSETVLLNDVVFDGNFASNDGANPDSIISSTIYGGAVANTDYASMIINNATFSNNYVFSKANYSAGQTISLSVYGGAISFTGYGNYLISNAYFTNNHALSSATVPIEGKPLTLNAYGGAVYNGLATSELRISNSVFSDNWVESAGGDSFGGAIYNDTGTLWVTNSDFINNEAFTLKGKGGAIYNAGTLNLTANDYHVIFTGNTANSESNAVYNTGTFNINTDKTGSVTFNDVIESADYTNEINLNDSSVRSLVDGEIIFNNAVKKSSVNLFGGTMTIGRNGDLSDTYIGLNGGGINLQNGQIDIFDPKKMTLSGTINLFLDLNTVTQTGDLITTQDFIDNGGSFTISGLGLLADSGKVTEISVIDPAFADKVILADSAAQITTPVYRYDVSYDALKGTLSVSGRNEENLNPKVYALTASVHSAAYFQQLRSYEIALNNWEERRSFWLVPFYSNDTVNFDYIGKTDLHQYGVFAGIDTPPAWFSSCTKYAKMSFYVGSVGSKETWENTVVRQNGVIGGAMFSLRTKYLFAGITGNIGHYSARSDGKNFSIKTAGLGGRAGARIPLGALEIQSYADVSVTYLNSSDFTNVDQVHLKASSIQVKNFSPKIRLKTTEKNAFSPYVEGGYVWNNSNDSKRFSANQTVLPNFRTGNYAEYAVGFESSVQKNINTFARLAVHHGDRQGVEARVGITVNF